MSRRRSYSDHDLQRAIADSRSWRGVLRITSVRGQFRRVQVKSTRTRAGDTWKVHLSTSRGGRTAYGPDEIDDFVVVDGDGNCYLLPIDAVGGFHLIHLSVYERFRVASGVMGLQAATVDSA